MFPTSANHGNIHELSTDRAVSRREEMSSLHSLNDRSVIAWPSPQSFTEVGLFSAASEKRSR